MAFPAPPRLQAGSRRPAPERDKGGETREGDPVVYLNVLDNIGIAIYGRSAPLLDYLMSDYGAFEVEALPVTRVNIAVQFVDEAISARNCIKVRGPVAYDDRGVLLRDARDRVFRIDFDSARARTWRATCDAEFDPQFFEALLDHMIHFQLLKRGKTFCHAAAFRSGGAVALCAGARGIGKTSLLLHALRDGASFIADDWAVLQGGGTVQGLAKRLNLLYPEIQPFPELLAALPEDSAALAEFVGRAAGGDFELDEQVALALGNRTSIQLPATQLFGQAIESDPSPVDHVYLLQRRATDDGPVKIEPIDHDALVTCLAAILEFEQSDFLLAYSVFRARTGHHVELFDLARSGGEAVLIGALADTASSHRVTIPLSCPPQDVYATVANHLGGAGRSADRDGGPKTRSSPAAA